MVEAPHLDAYIQMFSTLFALAIAWYCFRLASFLKGGIFYGSFRMFGPAFLLYSIGSFFDIFPELGIGEEWFHMIHLIFYAASFTLVTYGFNLFYQAWKKMGIEIA